MTQEYGIDDLRSFDRVRGFCCHELYPYLPICSSACELTMQEFHDFRIIPTHYIRLPFENQAKRTLCCMK